MPAIHRNRAEFLDIFAREMADVDPALSDEPAPLAEAARQAAVIAGWAVEHGLSWLGAGEGPVHVLHEYRAMTAPAPTGRPRDERQLKR